MATSLRFALTNLIETAALQNGGAGPARDEVSPWVMENAQNRDRFLVWQAGASLNVDFLLASPAATTYFAVLGHRGAPSTAAGITSVEVFTQTGAYAVGGVWTSRGTIALGAGVRDKGLLIASVTPASIRYAITAATAFTIGRLFAGTLEVDLEIVSSPGYERRYIDPQLETRNPAGDAFITYTGEPHWEYRLPYNQLISTQFDKVSQIGRRRRTFVMLDRDDTVFEARVRSPFQHQLMYDAPDNQNAALEIETLS